MEGSLRGSLFAADVKIPCKRAIEAFDECKAGRKERSERASTRDAKPSDNLLEEMAPNIAPKRFVGVWAIIFSKSQCFWQ